MPIKTKVYFQLRICRNCDKQRMVDLRGLCSECSREELKSWEEQERAISELRRELIEEEEL